MSCLPNRLGQPSRPRGSAGMRVPPPRLWEAVLPKLCGVTPSVLLWLKTIWLTETEAMASLFETEKAALMISESPSGSFSFLEEQCMLAPWSSPVGSMKSNRLPSFRLIFFPVLFSSSQQYFCWYNPISMFGFCWDGWLGLWVAPVISLPNGCWGTSSVFFLERTFSFFAIWVDWEFSKSQFWFLCA